ncbi:MAG: DUF4214 domain-containing protein [Burkholderiales bacterium]|nr:DUF4214 domain-containing protein [Burkholderiales bacterium]
MTTTIHPAAWAEQLRAIHQAFALREQALLTQLVDTSSELRAEFLAQQEEREQGFNAELATALADARSHGREEFTNELQARLREQQDRFELDLQASLKEAWDKCDERLTAAEATFRNDLALLETALTLSLTREAQTEATLRAELLEVEEAARVQLNERLRREQEVAAQWLAMHAQFEQGRSADTTRHHEQLESLEANHLERERAWGVVSDSRASDFRARIESERLQTAQLQRALRKAEDELADVRGSVLFRLAGLFDRRYTASPMHDTQAAGPDEPSPTPTTALASTEHTMQSIDQPGTEAQSTHASTMTMQTRAAAAASPQTDLQAILHRGGNDFVHTAYWTLLGRKVDSDGLRFYRLRLLSGVSKLQILGEIAQSPEAAARGVAIPGLREALRRQRWLAMPILGLAISWLRPVGHRSATSTQLQSLEARAEYGLQELQDRLSSVDNELATLRDQIHHLSVARKDSRDSVAADRQGERLSLTIPDARHSAARSRRYEPSPLEAVSIRDRS